jgi:hypothetical protein
MGGGRMRRLLSPGRSSKSSSTTAVHAEAKIGTW